MGKPRRIVQIAGDVFLPLPGGQQLIAHSDDVGKIQIVDFAASVVAGSSGAVQTASEVDHRRGWMAFQIIPHLPREVILPHGDLQ